MAAIYEPRRRPAAPERPHLRLVPAGPGATVPVQAPLGLGAELGIGVRHLVGAVAALVVVLIASLAIGNGALASLAPAPSPAGGASSSAVVEPGGAVVVEPGDTLWTIARRVQPSGDVRPLVDQLIVLNGSAPLQAGATVQLPA